MDVVAWSANLTGDRTEPDGVRLAGSRDELLETSDVVSVHPALSGRTYRGYYGEAVVADIAARLDEAPIRVPR